MAMPAWDRVKEVNTPMAYSGIRCVTSAWKTTTSTEPATARAMMPLENTRRWPRLVSCLGMNASSAWKLASRGKSAKLVLAASTRMSMVIACTTRNSDVAEQPRSRTRPRRSGR